MGQLVTRSDDVILILEMMVTYQNLQLRTDSNLLVDLCFGRFRQACKYDNFLRMDTAYGT